MIFNFFTMPLRICFLSQEKEFSAITYPKHMQALLLQLLVKDV